MKVFVYFAICVLCLSLVQGAALRRKRQSKVPPHADNSYLFRPMGNNPGAHDKGVDDFDEKNEEPEDDFDSDHLDDFSSRKKRAQTGPEPPNPYLPTVKYDDYKKNPLNHPVIQGINNVADFLSWGI